LAYIYNPYEKSGFWIDQPLKYADFL